MQPSLWPFIGISLLVIVIPGPDTALTIRNSLAGRADGIATALGVVTGQLAWELGTAAGLTAILLASEQVFHAVKLAGAVYLLALGAQSLVSALRARRRLAQGDHAPAPVVASALRAFRQGLISNLGNPKMAVFFASILPQFTRHGHETFASLMALGLVFSAMTAAWLCAYAFAISRATAFFRRPRVERAIEGVTGVALIGLGTRLVFERD